MHAWVSHPSSAAAAAVPAVDDAADNVAVAGVDAADVVVAAAVGVAAAAVLRAVVAKVEDLGIPQGVQLAVEVVV